MTNSSARRWLGLYFLLASTGLGLFLLLFTGSAILPLDAADGSAAFQILLPVFVGQLTVIFRWIAGIGNEAKDANAACSIPGWAVRIPPILAVTIVVCAAFALAAANSPTSTLKTSPETFKASVTFAVTILNATTVYLVTKLFPGEHKN
jgi:hypothetical protein